MKNKKCKSCGISYTPQRQAQPRCRECTFKEVKEKIQKPIVIKIDKRWQEISEIVRLRDKGLPCISCNREMKEGYIDAGHFISRNKCKELYYDLDNIHAQCRICNNNHQRQQEIHAKYRENLIKKIGIDKVKYLEQKEMEAGRYSLNNI